MFSGSTLLMRAVTTGEDISAAVTDPDSTFHALKFWGIPRLILHALGGMVVGLMLLGGSEAAWSQVPPASFIPKASNPSDPNDDSAALELIEAILPPGLTIIPGSARITGDFGSVNGLPTNALGLFENLTTIFGSGPTRGVLLTNGSGTNALPSSLGCATSPNCSSAISQENLVFGNPALSALIGGPTFDATTLNFSFQVDPNLVGSNSFRLDLPYVFGSDEYNEFTNTAFSDVFGLFIDGQNIAVAGDAPGTVVSVRTLNGSQTASLFRNNDSFFTIDRIEIDPPDPDLVDFQTEYDGLSVELMASTILNKGIEYDVLIAIADAASNQIDSGVFLTRGSLTALDPPPNLATVPGPLAWAAVVTAFGWSRRIRRRLMS